MQPIWTYLDGGLDPATTDRSVLSRTRIVNFASAVMVVVGGPFVFVNLAAGRTAGAAGLAATLVLCLINAAALRRTRRVSLCGTVFSVLCLAHLAAVAIEMRHPALYYWFFLIPLLGALVGGLRAGWALAAMSIGVATYLWIAPAPEPVADFTATHLFALRTLSMICVATFMTIFVTAQRVAENSQRATNEQLRRETVRVHLMSEIAVAANQAATMEDALRTSIEKVCTLTDWSIGHAWTVSTTVQDPPVHVWHLTNKETAEVFRETSGFTLDGDGPTPADRLRETREPYWIGDPSIELPIEQARAASEAGLRAGIVLPVVLGDELIAVMEFYSDTRIARDPTIFDVMSHITAQVARVAERNQAETRISALAYYDGLTGLPNRQLFKRRLAAALETAAVKSTEFGLLFIDLDGFKGVNDSLGHAAGDSLLQLVATRLVGAIRVTDCITRSGESGAPVSRLAGDEFTVILPDLKTAADAGLVAQRLLSSFAEPFDVEGHEVFMSATIGVALYPTDGDDAETLLARADAAMYHAKSRGKNQFQYYTRSMNSERDRIVALGARLHRALERGDFSLHFQPIRDAETSRLAGAEALLRWNDEELGPVSPEEFIPIAEKTGLIVPIGRWVLQTACEQLRTWREAGYASIRCSVNVSGIQIRTGQLLEEVGAVLRETGTSPSELELEITESTIMRDDDVTRRCLDRVSALGVNIALDDFGCGYSSLSYLRRFPIGCVKIDRSFVREIVSNPDDQALTGAIIAMAHGLRMRVVAEGVESIEQAQLLRAKGCDELQGYLLSPPLSAPDFERLLEQAKAG